MSPTLRQPTPPDEAYRWYAGALKAAPGDLARGMHENYPEAGWYKRRFTSGAVWVPARVWLIQYVADGELIAPERIACEIGGEPFDPFDVWISLCEHPITKAEFDHMMRVRDWARSFRPDQPEAAPMKPVDLFTVQPPSWGRRSKRKN